MERGSLGYRILLNPNLLLKVSTDGAPPKPTTGAESGPNGAKIKELEVDDARSYQVQRVIGMRHKKRVRDFLIKWTGYEDLEWTPEKNCGQCKLAIKKFKNDMGWLILKPRTLDGEWLLPTDKWNFEEVQWFSTGNSMQISAV
ncbi:hypothetical protein AAVH_14285 [Aphelenchoides avenae]|nr:hypothetical protein AAVH_14285 [Aphelenchus avenae]